MKRFFAKNKEDIYDLLFRIGMGWRIFYGSLRLMLGFALLRVIGTPLAYLFYRIMSPAIIEDPNDFLLRVTGPLLQHLSLTVTYFLAAYLIFWGIVDIFFSISLLKHRMWAFPVSIYLIGAFVLYELYRFSHTHSLILAGVIAIDLVLLWLIREEYHELKVR